MKNILNYTLPELTSYFAQLGEPAFRARQVWQWLWKKGARSFQEMSDISLTLRTTLEAQAAIIWPEVADSQISADGTVKLLLRLQDGALVETVLIPSESQSGMPRIAQCLSCQVGCAMGCTFCATGALGFTRNMSMGEILGQVLVAKAYLQDYGTDAPILRNLVFMGMGEPLLNLDMVLRSLETLNDPLGLAFSPRRITVSTCGIEQGLTRLGQSKLAYLAVSLHAPTQELRAQLMPKAARWDLHNMMSTLASYPLATREKLTFEYLLLGGINDSTQHAHELVRLLSHSKSKVNLIAYNPTEGSAYTAPSPQQILAFEKVLWAKGITAILRKSKGQDINAACGQLAAKQK